MLGKLQWFEIQCLDFQNKLLVILKRCCGKTKV